MARKKSTSRSKSRAPRKQYTNVQAIRSKANGKIIGFRGYTKAKTKDGRTYMKHIIRIPKSQWPKNVSKAQIEKNNISHLNRIRKRRGKKSRSKSATRSKSSLKGRNPSRSSTRSKSTRSKSSRKGRRGRKSRSYKPITKAQAEMAFNRWYKDAYRKGKFASAKGMRASMTYDLNHRSKVVKDERYLKNPHKYDFRGIDDGPMPKRRLTGAAKKSHERKKRSMAARRRRSKSRRSKSTRSKSTRKGRSKSRSYTKKRRSEAAKKGWRKRRSASRRSKSTRSKSTRSKSRSYTKKRRSEAAKKGWRKRRRSMSSSSRRR